MEWWCHAVARAVSVSLVSFFLLPVRYGAAAQLTKVRISYSSRSNSNTPFIIALNKGFFCRGRNGRGVHSGYTCHSERERGIFRNSV